MEILSRYTNACLWEGAIAGLALIVLVWRIWLRFRGPDFVSCHQCSHQAECISRCKRRAP